MPKEKDIEIEDSMIETVSADSPVSSILTIDNSFAGNHQAEEDKNWHDMVNAFKSRSILTGILDGVEKLDNGNHIVIVYYKGIRVVIPISEMNIFVDEEEYQDRGSTETRKVQIVNNMMGCEIDFIIKGMDGKEQLAAVASRKDAMLRKRQQFYILQDNNGLPRIYEDRIIEARIISIAEKAARVEVFGVEVTISNRDLTWEWMINVNQKYSIGDRIKAIVKKININSIDDMSIELDVKSLQKNTVEKNLERIQVQGRYSGQITGIYKGVIFIHLSCGVNAVAHTCKDQKDPGRGDSISFVVTTIDRSKNVAVGIITKIIKQNIL